MIIKKLVMTKNGNHYFRKVRNLKNRGIFWVEDDEGLYVFHDKKQLNDFSELCDAIKRLKDAYIRDLKIEEVLK